MLAPLKAYSPGETLFFRRSAEVDEEAAIVFGGEAFNRIPQGKEERRLRQRRRATLS
jgi:hypothetical protein